MVSRAFFFCAFFWVIKQKYVDCATAEYYYDNSRVLNYEKEFLS